MTGKPAGARPNREGMEDAQKVSGDCGCPFDCEYTCPACGHTRITNHCPHDGVQNRCPRCGWLDPGKQSPLQSLGVTAVPGENSAGG